MELNRLILYAWSVNELIGNCKHVAFISTFMSLRFDMNILSTLLHKNDQALITE